MQKIKNIIFDFDGILVDDIDLLLKVHNETLGVFSKKEQSELFKGNSPEGLKKYSKIKIENFWTKWKLNLKDFKITEESLGFLKHEKTNNFIISSNKESIIERILKNSEATKYFKAILGKDTHKSKIEKIKILKEKYGIELSETIFITDSSGDLKEASHFPELKTLGVTFGVHCRETLKTEKPDFVCDSWEGIKVLRSKLTEY